MEACTDDKQRPPQGWEEVVLNGGPADGRRVELPKDARHYVAVAGFDNVTYWRRGRSAVFDAETIIADRLAAGGAR